MSKDLLINSLVAFMTAMAMLVGVLLAGADLVTVDAPNQSSCQFLESENRMVCFKTASMPALPRSTEWTTP